MDLKSIGLAEDPQRPAYTILSRELVRLYNELIVWASETERLIETLDPNDPKTRSRLEGELSRLSSKLQTAKSLSKWVFPERIPLSAEEALAKTGRLLKDDSSDLEFLTALQPDLQKHNVGRPSRRAIYLAVFDLMLQSPQMSLGKARIRVAPCLTKAHEPSLKAGIRKLKNLLRTRAPELVRQFEEKHPDRARKVNG